MKITLRSLPARGRLDRWSFDSHPWIIWDLLFAHECLANTYTNYIKSSTAYAAYLIVLRAIKFILRPEQFELHILLRSFPPNPFQNLCINLNASVIIMAFSYLYYLFICFASFEEFINLLFWNYGIILAANQQNWNIFWNFLESLEVILWKERKF